MKKIVIAALLSVALGFEYFEASATCICYTQQKGAVGTWLEGSCRDGGNSCGKVCFCEYK